MEKRNTGTKKNLSFGREIFLLGFIIVLIFLIGLRNSAFLSMENFNDIFNDTAVLSICAVGMMMVIVTNGIDLSVGATLGLSGMICALVVKDNPGIPMVLVIVLSVAVGLFVGAVNGVLVARVRVLPIIATLGVMNIGRASIYFVSGGKWVNTFELDPRFVSFAANKFAGVSTLILSAIIIYIIFYYFTKYTRTGRQIYAVGSNPHAAQVSGISVRKAKFLAYLLLGGLTGFAGMLWTSRYGFASRETGSGFEMSVIAACVLGGVSITGGSGKIVGVLLGSLLIGIINSALPMLQVFSFIKDTIEGVIIFVAIIVNVLLVRRSDHQNLVRRNI